ncbi:MAG: ABC transporter permease [Magnetococcales bacterium]|nr:ABC transporter permease [Magnetococcales bacterium]
MLRDQACPPWPASTDRQENTCLDSHPGHNILASKNPVVIHEPTSSPVERIHTARSGILNPGLLFRELIVHLWGSRHLARQLFLRDIRQRYRQSVFGLLWILVPPLATTAIFVFLNARKILNIDPTDIPYPIYVLLGTLLWQIFSESVLAPLKAFDACTPIMIKINMPREAPILVGLLQVFFFMGIQLIPVIGIMIWSGVRLSPALLITPLAILMLILLGMSIGLCLVPLGGLFRDIHEGSAMALKLLFFLTPVVYPAPQEWPWSLIVSLNPVTPLLQGARDLMSQGAMRDPEAFWIVCLIVIVLLPLALIFYRLAVPLVLERMGA